MKNDNKKLWLIVGVVGLLVPVWLAVLIAPTLGGLPVMIPKMGGCLKCDKKHLRQFFFCVSEKDFAEVKKKASK